MRRDPRAYVWDAHDAATQVAKFTAGKSFAGFLGDLLLRSAVERQFTILGTALDQLGKHGPDLAAQVPRLFAMVALRDILIERSAEVNLEEVWRIARQEVPPLAATLAALLAEAGEPGR